MLTEKLESKLEWVKHWKKRGLSFKQSLIVIEQMLSPIPDGLDKNSNENEMIEVY